MSSEVACRAVALCEGWRHLNIESRDLIRSLPVRSTFGLPVYVTASPAIPFSTSLRFARNDSDCKLDAVASVRLPPHNRMKIGRVIRTTDQWSRSDVEKTFPACDVPVIIELLGRDVFNDGQMLHTRTKILAHG
jgi:hypothetical protein